MLFLLFIDEFASCFSDYSMRFVYFFFCSQKQGKKMRREGKDRWLEFTSKVSKIVDPCCLMIGHKLEIFLYMCKFSNWRYER